MGAPWEGEYSCPPFIADPESGVNNPHSNASHFLPGSCGPLAGGGLWDHHDPDPAEPLKNLISDAAKFLKPDWDPVRVHRHSVEIIFPIWT